MYDEKMAQLQQKIAEARQRDEQRFAPQLAPDCCNVAQAGSGYRPPSLREEAEKSAHYYAEQAAKASASADFLRDHPEFDEFIRLVRSGAIQF
jgi:hypothetical protein